MAIDPNLDDDGQAARRELARIVEQARRGRGWSRATLAGMARVSEATVIAAEGGRGGLNVYARLLRVLGMALTAVSSETSLPLGDWKAPTPMSL